MRGEQVIYYANHQSMVDNFLIARLFHDHLAEEFPKIVAGNSLDSSLLQKAFGFELSKVGVCWIDRTGIVTEIKPTDKKVTAKMTVTYSLKQGFFVSKLLLT